MITLRVQRWPLFSLPRRAVAFLLTVEMVVLVAAVVTAREASADGHVLGELAGLILVGGIYAEVVDRFERVWIWLHTDRGASTRQAGILLFAGVLVLPAWAAIVQAAVIYAHALWCNRRHRTQPTFQTVYSAATVLGATMLACWVFDALHGRVSHPGPVDLLTIALTIVVYSGANLLILVTGMHLATAPPSYFALFPSRREIGYEGSKLLLGVLGALLVEQAPLLLPAIPLLAAVLHRSSLVRELMTDASTDGKTGLLTPKAWDRAADGELARCRREHAPIALMILDLDHFKLVNDEHGHATGDVVLRAVGALLRAQVRANDLVGRYGGEEFVVLLPDTTVADAADIADRMRRRVAQLEPVTGLRVTASLGVAACAAADVQVSDLFTQADGALYRAKAAGRDQIVVAG